MHIVLADNYGFCFGVKNALDKAYQANKFGKRVITLGAITHNKRALRELELAGIGTVYDIDDIDNADENTLVIIRAHGEPPITYQRLEQKNIKYLDLTCPSVKANQKLAKDKYGQGKRIIIAGDINHPEIVGINGWIDGNAQIFAANPPLDIEFLDCQYFLMAQTTFCNHSFEMIAANLKNRIKNLEIANTICADTQKKQKAARSLAQEVDKMIVIGDETSSNSKKLYEICRLVQKNTYFIETIDDIDLKNFLISDKIGITAGASTPPATIEEAVQLMSDFEKNVQDGVNEQDGANAQDANSENFEQMLGETISSLHTGQVVTGKVISIVNGEVMVDLQHKSDGVIQRGQFSDNPNLDPSDVVKPGDEIEVFVLRVNDGEGNVLLSKRRIDAQKGYKEVDAAFESGAALMGRVSEIVKGGAIANISGVRTFVPSSQMSERFTKDLTPFIGKEFNFNIIELDKAKRPWRIIAGRRNLAAKEAQDKKDNAINKLEEGMKVSGKVSSIASFGAFVDLDGIDGLIHVSELSWGRVKNVADVLKQGDIVDVYVIKLDKEKGKVSLSLKDIGSNPWNDIMDRYPLGSIVNGKVVRMVSFGAFVELEEGVDGLVHISQISHKHVVKPEDELAVNQTVSVKITEINTDTKKISLSIKEAMDIDYDDYDDDDYDDEYYAPDGNATAQEADANEEVAQEAAQEAASEEPKE